MHELPPDFIRAQLDAIFDDIGVDAAKTGMLFSRTIIETVAEFLERHPVPLVVDPVLIASSGAQLLQDDAVETLIEPALPARDGGDAEPARGGDADRPARSAATGARRAAASSSARRRRSSPAVTATSAVDHLFDGREHVELPVERHAVAATHGAGCTHSATLAALLARGLPLAEAARGAVRGRVRRGPERPRRDRRRRRPRRRPQPERKRMSIDPGATLGVIRERKPLVHNITNYVVMNETANAILALGALPVMAHAKDEVREMVGLAGALVLNIGTLSEDWIEAMLLAGAEANERGVPIVLDPVGAGATKYRTDTAKRILDVLDVAVLRGNAGEVATLVGVEAEVRGVESVGGGGDPAELARAAATDARRRRVRHRPGRPRLRRRARRRRSRTGTSCSLRSRAPAACRPR